MFDVGNDFSANQIMCYSDRTSDTVFRREIDSRRQWGYGTCYGGIVSPLRRSVTYIMFGSSDVVDIMNLWTLLQACPLGLWLDLDLC